MKHLLLLLFLFGAFVNAQELELNSEEKSWLKEHRKIRVSNETNWAPIDFIYQGKPAGISVDMMNLVAEKLGIEIEYVNGYTWNELLEMSRQKEIDVLTSVVETESRHEFLEFTKGYIVNPIALYTHKNTVGIRTLDDMKGKTMVVIRGFYHEEILKKHYPEIKVYLVDSLLDGLQAVAFGKGDAITSNSAPSNYLIEQNLLNTLKIAGEIDNKHMKKKALRFGVRKDWPILKNLLNKALKAVTASQMRRIRAKWLTKNVEVDLDLTESEKIWIKKNPQVLYAGDPSWPPMSFYREDGQYDGLVHDYMEELQRISGLEFVHKKHKMWSGSLEDMKQGRVDMLDAVSKTEERKKWITFSDVYLELEVVMISRDDIIFLESMDDLKKKKIGTTAGYVISDYIIRDYPDLSLKKYKTISEGLVALSNKDIDVYITNIPSFDFFSESLGLKGLKVSGITPYKFNLGLGLQKNSPELLSIINKSIKKISRDRRQEIFQKWVSVDHRPKDYSWLKQLATLCLIALTIILLWVYQLRQKTNALTLSEERFKQAMNVASEGVFEWKVKENKFYFSPGFLTMLGYKPNELPQETSTWKELVHDGDWEAQWPLARECLYKGRNLFKMEYRMLAKDLSYRHVLARGKVVERDEEGKALRVLGTHIDIEDRKVYETELLDAREQAEAANRAKSAFLANMSHEIRTPMNAVLGFSNLLAKRLTEKQNIEYINAIGTSSRSLLRLINDILDLSKVESGKFSLQYKPVEMKDFFGELTQIFSPRVAEKEIGFELNIPKSFPKVLVVDEIRLLQVLFNLVGNAIKFTDNGSVKINVTASKNENRSDVTLSIDVEDTGIGIPESEREKIFETFEQVNRQSYEKYGGTGLGLSISQKLVDLMGGKIDVISEEGKGSIFSVTLPNIKLGENSEVLPVLNDDYETYSFLPATVMIVDDVALNRDLLESYFQSSDLKLIMASDGQEAIDLAKTEDIDLILMDIKMPKVDGLTASRKIKNFSNVPIIIVSTSTGGFNQRDVDRYDGFLFKPVKEQELIQELSRFLDYRRISKGTPVAQIAQVQDTPEEAREKNRNLAALQERVDETIRKMTINEITELIEEVRKVLQKSPSSTGQEWLEETEKALIEFDMKQTVSLLGKFKDLY